MSSDVEVILSSSSIVYRRCIASLKLCEGSGQTRMDFPSPFLLMPPCSSLSISLPSQILDSFHSALDKNQINFFKSSSVELATDPDGFNHLVHVVPDLANKPAVPLK